MLRPNDRIGPYTLISKLGRGTFGVVWLAEKRTRLLTTRVALKVPHDEEVELDAVRREASVWLHAGGHPNILPIIDADIYDDQVVIVSEYAPEGSLTGWLSRHGGKAPCVEAAVNMIDGVLAGLEHLHSKNIIHRDLKPDNILLQGETPRLADFGIARILRNTSPYSTKVSGTPKYMAPEAYKGRRSEQTDLWSVGVVLQQLLTGFLAFPQEDSPSLMYAVLTEQPQPLPASIPNQLRHVVAKALEKEPDRRYSTAREMRAAIQRFIHGKSAPGPTLRPYSQPTMGDVLAKRAQDEVPTYLDAAETVGEEDTRVFQAGNHPAKQLQFEYWTELNKLLRKHNSVVRLEPARPYFSISGVLGHPKVNLFATANTRASKICVGVRIFNRKDIYRALEKESESIEAEIGGRMSEDFLWREKKNYQTISEISLCWNDASITQRERWQEYLEWHKQKLESLYRTFYPRVKGSNVVATSSASTEKPDRSVRKTAKPLEISPLSVDERTRPPAQIDAVRDLLTRIPSHSLLRRLLILLYEAADEGLSTIEIAERMKCTRKQVSDVLGTLGSRIKGTPALSGKGPLGTYVEAVLDVRQLGKSDWHFKMKPTLRKALEEVHDWDIVPIASK